MNARLLLSVVDDADHIYRERFLRERYELTVHTVSGAAATDGNDVIGIAEVVEEESDEEPPEAA